MVQAQAALHSRSPSLQGQTEGRHFLSQAHTDTLLSPGGLAGELGLSNFLDSLIYPGSKFTCAGGGAQLKLSSREGIGNGDGDGDADADAGF